MREAGNSSGRSRIKTWLLLYWPAREWALRAWLWRLSFYFFAFLVAPLLSVLAFGAYIGPDRTPNGFGVVALIALLAVFVRARALRADASFGHARASRVRRRLIEDWPFPLEEPPPRRPFQGCMMSAAGTVLLVIGMLGGGLAGNGVAWPILIFSGVEIKNLQAPSVLITLVAGTLAVVLGVCVCVYCSALGIRLLRRGRRLRTRDARLMFLQSGEQPVLLLRSFDDDELADPRPLNFLQRRFEENLNVSLRQLGPVITVGRPTDPLGFAGAARFYVSNENWQSAIRYLMVNTCATVIVVGTTEGLWWEIRNALESVPLERLLFCFPLIDKSRKGLDSLSEYKEFFKRWNLQRKRYEEMEARRSARYQLFHQRAAEHLRTPLPGELKKDAFFLDFMVDGQARFLRARRSLLRNHMADLIPKHRRLNLDMPLTLWPFLAKLYRGAR